MKKFLKINKNTSGFSLIELLVVTAIIGTMTAITLVSLSGSRDDRAVDAAARQVAATLRLAQGYAVTGRIENDDQIPCAFLFSSDASTGAYVVTYTYHAKGSDCPDGVGTVASYTLENDVSISDADITFGIPQGTASQATSVTVSRGTESSRICVDAFGRIEEGC